jgi:hypothetical protein
MIPRPFRKLFKDPNFSCTVRDYRGRQYKWLLYADSEADLRKRLKERRYSVIHIRGYSFGKWKNEARKAKLRAIDSFKKNQACDFTPRIWEMLKAHLFDLFNGKCAFCESKPMNVYGGAVDHYRPKGKPLEDDRHPGYYWLAYEPSNLLPVCEMCNGARAKSNHFPVEGFRAYTPTDELERENRLLLTPYFDKPSKHLRFLPEYGLVVGLTPKGKKSIEIYDLNREYLLEKRKEAQHNIVQKLGLWLQTNNIEAFAETWTEMLDGEIEFSAAALSQAEYWRRIWMNRACFVQR